MMKKSGRKHRSALRLYVGKKIYSLLRHLQWFLHRGDFAATIQAERLPQVIATHHSPLIRDLKNVEMQYQYNKVKNIKIAIEKLNGLVIEPGETFSFWRQIGRTTRRKGYKMGFILEQGKVKPGIGGGLCQLSNLIYWMTLHTPLEVVERHRHSYDVFPDTNRLLPFGSGATVSYNYVDLQIKNNSAQTYQLVLEVDDEHLRGRWLSEFPIDVGYQVVEEGHRIQHETSGIYSRSNKIYRRTFEKGSQKTIDYQLIAENYALMMYTPLLNEAP